VREGTSWTASTLSALSASRTSWTGSAPRSAAFKKLALFANGISHPATPSTPRVGATQFVIDIIGYYR
jgi:hypothetical protein